MIDHEAKAGDKKRGRAPPADPLAGIGIAEYGARLRDGSITAEAATPAYLERIALLDGKLQAFVHVAGEQAQEPARAIDRLRASGTDLGPLMGVPVAVKDLFSISGMPESRCGSRVDIADLVEPEGQFIRRLKRTGCVILPDRGARSRRGEQRFPSHRCRRAARDDRRGPVQGSEGSSRSRRCGVAESE